MSKTILHFLILFYLLLFSTIFFSHCLFFRWRQYRLWYCCGDSTVNIRNSLFSYSLENVSAKIKLLKPRNRILTFFDCKSSKCYRVVRKVMRVYTYDILKCDTTDLTTHIQVVTDRYDTPTDPNA